MINNVLVIFFDASKKFFDYMYAIYVKIRIVI